MVVAGVRRSRLVVVGGRGRGCVPRGRWGARVIARLCVRRRVCLLLGGRRGVPRYHGALGLLMAAMMVLVLMACAGRAAPPCLEAAVGEEVSAVLSGPG